MLDDPSSTKDVPLTEDVRDFLRENIGSLEALEVLLLLRRTRCRAWSADQVARHLRLPIAVVETILLDLREKQLFATDEVGGTDWRFSPPSPELIDEVDRLAAAWQQQRIEVVRVLCTRALERVGELASMLQRAMVVAGNDLVTTEDELAARDPDEEWLDRIARRGLKLVELERAYFHAVLRVTRGNRSEAARRLGVDRRTLQRRIGEFGDDPGEN